MKEQAKQTNKKNPIFKAVQWITTALLIASTVLCFFAVTRVALKKDVSIFGYRLFYVVSGSMEPEIPVGSLLIVGESDEYRVGDVITFVSTDQTIKGYPNTHRIIDIKEKNGELLYITKGDANAIQDTDPVLAKDIIGKVRLSIDSTVLSSAISFLASPVGFFAVVLLPILFIAVLAMRSFVKTFKEEVRNAALAELNQTQVKTEECQEDERRQDGRNAECTSDADSERRGGTNDTTE